MCSVSMSLLCSRPVSVSVILSSENLKCLWCENIVVLAQSSSDPFIDFIVMFPTPLFGFNLRGFNYILLL